MEDSRAGLGGGCAEVYAEEEEGESDDDEGEEDVCSGTVAGRRYGYGWWVHSVRPAAQRTRGWKNFTIIARGCRCDGMLYL